MQIDKNQILKMLTDQGKQDTATKADQQLPKTVDTDQHADLLSRLGVEPSALVGLLGGQGGQGGAAGLLGKIL